MRSEISLNIITDKTYFGRSVINKPKATGISVCRLRDYFTSIDWAELRGLESFDDRQRLDARLFGQVKYKGVEPTHLVRIKLGAFVGFE